MLDLTTAVQVQDGYELRRGRLWYLDATTGVPFASRAYLSGTTDGQRLISHDW